MKHEDIFGQFVHLNAVTAENSGIVNCTRDEYLRGEVKTTDLPTLSASRIWQLVKGRFSDESVITDSTNLGKILHLWFESKLHGGNGEYFVFPPATDSKGKILRKGSKDFLNYRDNLQKSLGHDRFVILNNTDYEKFSVATRHLSDFLTDRKFLDGTSVLELSEVPFWLGGKSYSDDEQSNREEVSLFRDKFSLRGMPDFVAVMEDGIEIVDFKSTASSSMAGIARDIRTYRYDLQLQAYRHIVETVTRRNGDTVYPIVLKLVFFSTSTPYVPIVVRVPVQSIELDGSARLDDEYLQRQEAESSGVRDIWLDDLMKY